MKTSVCIITCTLLFLFSSWPASVACGADKKDTPCLSDIVLFGIQPVSELNLSLYSNEGKACLKSYLAAISPESLAILNRGPYDFADSIAARRMNLIEQMVTILGQAVRKEAELFASAVPLSIEWEGMCQGPVAEADFADNWLKKQSESSISGFLLLFKAHRLRAGFEAAKSGNEKKLWPILAKRYRETIEKAKASSNALVSCIAGDLDRQPHVYLEGKERP